MLFCNMSLKLLIILRNMIQKVVRNDYDYETKLCIFTHEMPRTILIFDNNLV